MIIKTIKQHIRKLNSVQFEMLSNMCRHTNSLYNSGLYVINNYFKETNKYLGYNELYKEMKDNIHYKSIPAKIAQQTLRLLDKDFRSFFVLLGRKLKGKYSDDVHPPKYKKSGDKFILILPNDQVKLKNGILKITKDIKLPFSYELNGVIKQLVIKPIRNDYFTMLIQYEEKINKKYDLNKENYLSIDLGVNNLCSCFSNVGHSFIMNGKPLKSYNQYYNKRKTDIQSKLKKINDKHWSNKLSKITLNRSNYINEYFNIVIKRITDYCIENDIGNIVIGYNKEWKKNINIGKSNNQKFMSIPYYLLKRKLEYKCNSLGINFILQEESYTSKCSFLDNEEVKKQEVYKGKRIKRGLFKTFNNVLINADINGASNILKKVVLEVKLTDEIVVAMVQPVKISNIFTNNKVIV